jgi:hypothetical protein
MKIVVEKGELTLKMPKDKQPEPITLQTYYKYGCPGN